MIMVGEIKPLGQVFLILLLLAEITIFFFKHSEFFAVGFATEEFNDPVMDRVLKRSNCAPYDYVGKTVPMGKVHALAALLDCTEERIAGLREFADIHNDVFIDDEEALALFAAKNAAAKNPANQDHKPLTDLEKYFVEQMSAAKTEAERQDVLKLIEALTDTFTPEQRTALLETPRAFAHEA